MIKSASKLFLFTNVYPFGNEEVFIENEIKVIAKYFDEIHVFPIHSKTSVRKYPANVKVHLVTDKLPFKNTLKIVSSNFFLVLKISLNEFLSSGAAVFLKYFKTNLSSLSNAIRLADYLTVEINNISSEDKLFYSYWMNNWALTCAVMKYKKKINRFIFRVHGYDLYDYLRPDKYIQFKKFNMEMCDGVFTVCKAAYDYLSNKNIYPDKIKMSHLGVFDNGCNPYSDSEKFTIVSCSSLNIFKRVDKIIEVLMHIDFPVKWIHFGGQGDWLSCEQFLERCKKLPENIEHDFRGAVRNEEVLDFYRNYSVNLFIHLTFTEGGVPLVLQEAASFGIPLMSTNTGGVPEIVNDQTGILIDSEFKIQDVVNKIYAFRSSIMNTPPFRENVRKFWQLHFNAETNYLNFFQQITSD